MDPELPQLNTETIELTPTETDTRLAKFAMEEILPRNKRPATMTMFLGEWYPVWRGDSKKIITFLRQSAAMIAELTGKKAPVFMDLGSGDGMVPVAVSTSASYSRCIGIELQKPLNDWSKQNVSKLEEQGIISPNLVNLHAGTYYSKRYWSEIKQRHDRLETDIHDWGASTGKIYERYLNPKHAIDAFLGPDGKLDVDVLFLYPSDPYIIYSKDQWDNIIRSGTILVLVPNELTKKMEEEGFFKDYEYVKRIEPANCQPGELPGVDVYRKIEKLTK